MATEKPHGREVHSEERLLAREASGSSLVAYAAIKYFSFVVIVVAILYFLGRWVLPLLVS